MNKINLNEIIKNGGATLDKDLQPLQAKKGYMYSIIGYEKIYNLDDTENILKTIKEYQKILKNNCYIGLWIDNNKLYIDISKLENNKTRALQLAKDNMQLAIYDIAKNENIYLKDIYYTIYSYNEADDDIKYLNELEDYKQVINYLKDNFNIKANLSNYITTSLDDLKVINDIVIFKSEELKEY